MKHLSFNSYIKFEKETLNYFESPEGVKSGLHINKYYDTYIKDFQFKSGPKPEFNPWEYSTFKTGKTLKDVYSTWGKIQKGFFISKRFKDFLSSFDIGEHLVFDDIKYFNGSEFKDDMSWISFYEDYWNCLDFNHSKFVLYDRTESSYKEDGSENYIKNNITFKDMEEYNKELLNLQRTNLNIRCYKGYINTKLDLFPLFHISSSTFIVSDRFSLRAKNEKFKGIEFFDSLFAFEPFASGSL
jgi:hypothetical protein